MSKPDDIRSSEIKRYRDTQAPTKKSKTGMLHYSIARNEVVIQEIQYGFSYAEKPFIWWYLESTTDMSNVYVYVKEINMGKCVLCSHNVGKYDTDIIINFYIKGYIA